MKLPSVNTSTLFPSWLTNMTLVSLFMSIFGLATFSVYLIGSENVDMWSILELSQTLPNPFDSAQVIFDLYDFNLAVIKKIDILPPSIEFANGGLLELVEDILEFVIGLVRLVFYGILMIPSIIVSIVLVPVSLVVWILGTFASVFNVITGSSLYVLNFDIVKSLISSWRGVLGV